MDTISQKVISALESVKVSLEKKDEELTERKQYFAAKPEEKEQHNANKSADKQLAPADSSSQLDKMKGAQVDVIKQQHNFSDFQQVGYELLDIGIHYGSKTVEHVKGLPVYKKIDSYIDFDDKFAIVLKHSQCLYTYVDSTFRPIMQRVLFLYNSASQKVTTFINLVTERQEQIVEYVRSTYSLVSVTVNGNWMRLDFDKDGSVSVMDLKKSMIGLYAFLADFDVLEETSMLKCQLYSAAIDYMQRELDEKKKKMSGGKAAIAAGGKQDASQVDDKKEVTAEDQDQ